MSEKYDITRRQFAKAGLAVAAMPMFYTKGVWAANDFTNNPGSPIAKDTDK